MKRQSWGEKGDSADKDLLTVTAEQTITQS